MVFRRRVVEENVPVVTPVVTPVQSPVIERNTVVERDDSVNGGIAAALVILGVLAIAFVWYFAWYQPTTVATTPSNTTIIHDSGSAAQPIVNNPPTVVNNPPNVTVNTPAQAPSTTIVNPPSNTTVVNPPVEPSSTTTTTDNGDGTTTTTTDNNGG